MERQDDPLEKYDDKEELGYPHTPELSKKPKRLITIYLITQKKINKQNTTNKRRSSLAFIWRSSEGSSLSSSGFNMDTEPWESQA